MYGKRRLNVDMIKCMQETICGCQVSTLSVLVVNFYVNYHKYRQFDYLTEFVISRESMGVKNTCWCQCECRVLIQ